MMQRPKPLLIAAALLAVSVMALSFAAVGMRPRRGVAAAPAAGREPSPPALTAHEIAIPALPAAGLLDGVPVIDADLRQRADSPPVAVMVDNWVDARPQSGLDRAEIVYEALVEYDITRFMAVYWRTDAPVVGPVRSARTQYLGMVSELGAVYTHVGAAAEEGPADAEGQMRAWGIHELDEVAGGVIHRDPARVAPYNAYTSTDAIRAAARANGWTAPAAFPSWTFKADGGARGRQATAAALDFDVNGEQKGAMAVRWEYDAATNRYKRFEGGAAHVDARTGEQLTAKNVILQFEEVRPAGDRSGHVLYGNEGSGKAVLLLDGVAVDATWHKDSRTGRTRYLDAAGREVPLNQGNTWVEMLPLNAPVTIG